MSGYKVEICGVNTAKLPLLSSKEKEELFEKILKGDKDARERYIKGNLRLVLSVIQRFSGSQENLDDLFQIGCIGLIKAIDNFDITQNVKFSTYAVPLIIGEIRRYLRDDGMLKVSRTLKEAAWKVSQAVTEWQNEYGRDPTLEELSGKTGMSSEEIVQSLEANTDVDSLHDRFPEMRERRSHLANRSGIRKI